MPRLPIRFTIRALLIAVALLGLNLATTINALTAKPRSRGAIGMHNYSYIAYDDGSMIAYPDKHARAGAKPIVVRPPSQASRVRRWRPVVVSLGITVVTLGIALARVALRTRGRSLGGRSGTD